MDLIEFVNTSLTFQPESQAHTSYVTNPQVQECAIVHELQNDEKCKFVRQTAECHGNDHYLDYTEFYYCVGSNAYVWLFLMKIVLLIILCAMIFVVLGETADRFFCSALAALSKSMGLSENLAGITLLAFGNGSPDIFTALADFNGDSDMMYAELVGAAVFIIGVVSASIIIIRPFTVRALDLVRDCFFFMIVGFWLTYAFNDEEMSYSESIITIGIYILYLVVVFADHFWSKYLLKHSIKKQLETLENRTSFRIHGNHPQPTIDIEVPSDVSLPSPNSNLTKQLFDSLNPIEDWDDASRLDKLCIVIKAPIILMLTIIIPIVDYSAPNHGWSKLLNVLHVLLLPMAVIILKQFYYLRVFGLTIFAYVIPLCALLAILVFLTSRTDQPPKYHLCFAVLGSFVGSIVVISSMASEVVAVLSTLGIIGNLSNSFLGLSVLAWGNSVGDLISNIALARKGYYRMGFSACFGGPLFNTLIGIGIVFILKNYYATEKWSAFARDGPMGKTCTFILLNLAFFVLLSFAFCRFQGRRSVGYLMLSTYVVLLIHCALSEFEIIHAYGTDHQNEGQYRN